MIWAVYRTCFKNTKRMLFWVPFQAWIMSIVSWNRSGGWKIYQNRGNFLVKSRGQSSKITGILIAVRKGGWYWRWLKSCTCWYGKESPFFFRVWILYINSLKLTAKAPENGWLEYVGILISFWCSILPTGFPDVILLGQIPWRFWSEMMLFSGHCVLIAIPMRAHSDWLNLYVFHSLKVLNSYRPCWWKKECDEPFIAILFVVVHTMSLLQWLFKFHGCHLSTRTSWGQSGII